MRLPRNARLKLFYYFLKPFSAKRRAKRMRVFVTRMHIKPNLRILDLGGTPWIWSDCEIPLKITFLNLEYSDRHPRHHDLHTFKFEIGDACDIQQFGDKSFDIVFSNSVIEHVGDPQKRSAFAAEVRRMANAYWIQTPEKSFPIEAHTGMPFWWYYPEPLRRYFRKRWQDRVPDWTKMVEGTTYVTNEELNDLFSGSLSYSERVFGILKSNCRFVPYT